MIETLTNIIERSIVLVTAGRVEIFVAEPDHGFSWGALSKPRPGVWRGTHVAIITDNALEGLDEEHQGFAKKGYLYTSRRETGRTSYLNVQDGANESSEVRVKACITPDGKAKELTIIRPLRKFRR